jgi:integration host factor subunit alpha
MRVGFSKKDSLNIVENVLEIMKGRLEKGEKVKISGFGNFVVKEKNPRRGRNPQTGEKITIKGRRILSFKPSNVLRRLLNGKK